MQRTVEPEALDALDAQDPAAQHSRRDLARLHWFMGTVSILHAGLRRLELPTAQDAPIRILEIGAGDGILMLRLAGLVARKLPPVALTLLDRQSVVSADTIARYAALGWQVETSIMEIETWAARHCSMAAGGAPQAHAHWDLVVANLFLHHFSEDVLAEMFQAIAATSDRFLACEPRRAPLALGASHLVGLIGANAVTREDAVLSVQAGFRDRELSALWDTRSLPASVDDGLASAQRRQSWQTDEYPAGLFSHCFAARRRRTQ